MKEGTRVLVALGAAVAIGAVVAASGSPVAVRVAAAVAPIGTLWVTAIRMTVIPLIVALIVTGVASAADVRQIGRLGTATLAVFLGLLSGAAVVVAFVAPTLFSLLPDGARPSLPEGAATAARDLTSGGQAQTIANFVSSLLPDNPIGAAANGAIAPFILFVLLFAVAVARSSTETRVTLLAFFTALGEAMMTLVRGVIWCAPIGVFATVLPLAARAGASRSLLCPRSPPPPNPNSRCRRTSRASCCRSRQRCSSSAGQVRGSQVRCSWAGSTTCRFTHRNWHSSPLRPSSSVSPRRVFLAARSSCSRHC